MSAQRALKILLRAVGLATASAVFAAVTPTAWMAECHRRLGLGEMPAGAMFEYLARSLSAMYALLGGLLLMISRDVRRFRPLVVYVAAACIVLGVAVTVLDAALGLPWWWTLGEGPPLVPLGAAMLILQSRLPRPAPPAA